MLQAIITSNVDKDFRLLGTWLWSIPICWNSGNFDITLLALQSLNKKNNKTNTHKKEGRNILLDNFKLTKGRDKVIAFYSILNNKGYHLVQNSHK